jgi:hypothetical protein
LPVEVGGKGRISREKFSVQTGRKPTIIVCRRDAALRQQHLMGADPYRASSPGSRIENAIPQMAVHNLL